MFYFAYGSNMSTKRLRQRAPTARFVATGKLPEHCLRFNKAGKDGSGKCDASASKEPNRHMYGVVFDISELEKPGLDQEEGLGHGYEEKNVLVETGPATCVEAVTYYATHIDSSLKPYSWYKEHVLRGAQEYDLPSEYIGKIERIEAIEDHNEERNERETRPHR